MSYKHKRKDILTCRLYDSCQKEEKLEPFPKYPTYIQTYPNQKCVFSTWTCSKDHVSSEWFLRAGPFCTQCQKKHNVANPIEGSRSPKIDDKRRFLGSVTRPSPKTSKIKSTFLENVDGRTSIFGWSAVCTLCRHFSSFCCCKETIKDFWKVWGKCGGISCIQSWSNEGFRCFADVGWLNNPWLSWILGKLSH